MAKKRFYNQQRQTRRKRILIFLLILACGAVAWKFYSEKQDSDAPNPGSNPLIASELDVPMEPVTTTVEEIAEQISPVVNMNSPASIEIETPVAADPEPEMAASEPIHERPPVEKVVEVPGYASLAEARDAIAKEDYIAARQLLSNAIKLGLSPAQERRARVLVNQVSDQWLMSSNIFEKDAFCSRYKVVSGDMLVKIGKKFDVPYELIMKINRIQDPSRLRVGQTLKVIQGPFHVKINRSSYTMSVYLNDILVRSYSVGLGAPGRQTPTGLWRVRPGHKQVNPAWTDVENGGKHYYPDDPENPLGERWISLEGMEGDAAGREGFGIHGTIKPEEIGKSASRGCIRLLNKNVIELYDLMTEGKSDVWVMD